MIEEVVQGKTSKAITKQTRKKSPEPVAIGEVSFTQDHRSSTGIHELDRVLGGGLVPGSLVLVGGDPGIGKSTLLLQAVAKLAEAGSRVLYVSAEESLQQIKMRADRLEVKTDGLYLLGETSIESIERARVKLDPQVLVVDSIQTVRTEQIDGAVGSVGQIRAVTHELMELAKGKGVATFVVGHVTKEGTLAGPKVMEHMVDTVLYFEGERTGPYRILRTHKNRFGSAQEIGVFEMTAGGLRAVSNPSELFLSQRGEGPGAAVVTSVEGSRPLLLEVQALVIPSVYGTPRRTSLGFDHQRVAMLCAVLERRTGLEMGGFDVYVNITGGVKLTEPAADLGVIAALTSAIQNKPIEGGTVLIGEVGLSGEIRVVSNLAARVQEAAALGFSRCVVPKMDVERWTGPAAELPLHGAATLVEALNEAGLSV
jgi:DNA repair protein RadA/Sms